MAPPTGTLRVGRYFAALLAIIAVLYAIVFWPGQRHTPKLGLDLEGGTQVIFTAKTDKGGTPSSSSMDQAKQIMTERVNGTGATGATVVIQGSDQLVVSIPGSTATDIAKLGQAAELNFRGLVAPPVAVQCISPTTVTSPSSSAKPSSTPSTSTSTGAGAKASTSPSATHSGADAAARPLGNVAASASPSSAAKTSAAKTSAAKSTPASSTPSPTPSATPSPSGSAATPKCSTDSLAAVAAAGKFTVPLTDTDYAKLSSSNQSLIGAALANFDCSTVQDEKDIAKNDFIACADGSAVGGTTGAPYAVLLGPVIVAGKQIDSASAVAPDFSGQGGSSQWTVGLTLKGGANGAWAKYTGAHNIGSSTVNSAAVSCGASAYPCADYVAFTLDGIVVSAPVNESTINGGTTQISGGFTSSSAKDLANKLKYGALPLSFKAEQAETVSATLGSSQLKAGLLAGGIGLVLVVIYSLIYYRALGLVTIASLLVSGILTYGSLVMLGVQIDFTLSLAGIAGFIVAVGITADSFVVFFERMKDEVHEGRSARVAIPRAWVRARRTILSADTVSFLAAAILYYFAAGDVKGFAFTLGLSTILDLIVVFLFTHPLISFLSRFQGFGSARFTGLDAVRGGPAISETAPAVAARPGARKAGPKRAAAPTAVAVLDDEDADEPAQPDAVPEEDEFDTTATEDGSSTAAERRHTTPVPGSAAERAAARRARMRDRSGDAGDSEKGES